MLDFVKSYAFDCCCEQKTGGCRNEYPHRVAALLLFPRRTVPTLRSWVLRRPGRWTTDWTIRRPPSKLSSHRREDPCSLATIHQLSDVASFPLDKVNSRVILAELSQLRR